MNQIFASVVEFDAAAKFVEESSLVFVEDADYEFVGGGASVTNGL